MVCDGIAGGNGYIPPNNQENKKNFPNFLKNWNGKVLNGGIAENVANEKDKGKEIYLFPVGDGKDEHIQYIGTRDPQTGRTEYREIGRPRASIWIDIEGDGKIDQEVKGPNSR